MWQMIARQHWSAWAFVCAAVAWGAGAHAGGKAFRESGKLARKLAKHGKIRIRGSGITEVKFDRHATELTFRNGDRAKYVPRNKFNVEEPDAEIVITKRHRRGAGVTDRSYDVHGNRATFTDSTAKFARKKPGKWSPPEQEINQPGPKQLKSSKLERTDRNGNRTFVQERHADGTFGPVHRLP
jgi:hypothetical protein